MSHFIGRHIGGEIMALSSIVRRVESPVSRVIVWAQRLNHSLVFG